MQVFMYLDAVFWYSVELRLVKCENKDINIKVSPRLRGITSWTFTCEIVAILTHRLEYSTDVSLTQIDRNTSFAQ